jgi:beta-lactamase superfamily II metal-dependent hydrolase
MTRILLLSPSTKPSKTLFSSTLPFIEAVDPDIVVVSSGRKNFRGSGPKDVFLPEDSTLRRYCCHKPSTRIYRTDQNDEQEGHTTADDADGDNVIIRSNGSTIEVNAFEGGQPFTVNACEPHC